MADDSDISAQVVRGEAFLNFDPRKLPPLEIFFDLVRTREALGLRRNFIEVVLAWADRIGIDLLTLELSVVSDPRRNPIGDGEAAPSFTSNFWVNPAAAGHEENREAILRGYRNTIRGVEQDGTMLNDPSFHKLHYIHMNLDVSAIFRPGLQQQDEPDLAHPEFTQESVPIHAPPTSVPSHSVDDLRVFHEHFGGRLRSNLETAEAKLPFQHLHYLAVPCERLAADWDGSMERVSEDGVFPLEPSCAVFLTFGDRPSRPAGNQSALPPAPLARIESAATELQYMLSMMCQRQSAWFTDKARVLAESHRRTIEAYDAVGHVLRTFLGVTDYQQALGTIVAALGVDEIGQAHAALVQSRATLELFRHIDGLGSIFRLHGWMKDIESNAVRSHDALRSAREKVLGCYDARKIEDWLAGRREDSDLASLADALARFLAPIPARTGTKARLHLVGAGVMPVVLDHEYWATMDRMSGYAFPPFSLFDWSSNAILLTVLTGVLEPFRNAEDHLRRTSSPASGEAHVIEIVIAENQDAGYEVFVGNLYLGDEPSPPDVSRMSGGVRLVNEVLKDVMLGEMDGVRPSLSHMEQLGLASSQIAEWEQRFAWVRLLIAPIKLYKRVQDLGNRDGEIST